MRLYYQEQKSVRKIALELGMPKTTLESYFERFNIKLRSKSESSKERFKREENWCKGLTKETDSRIKEIGSKTKEFFKQKREKKIKLLELKFKKSIKKIIQHLYWNKCLTQEAIAKELELSRDMIIQLMKEHNIPRRPSFSYITSLKGKNHPQFGKTWEEIYGKERAFKRKEEFANRFREMILKRLESKQFFSDTKIERTIKQELRNMQAKFKNQYRIQRFVCDFAIPSCKLIIECDGDFWHANPNIYDRTNPSGLHPTQQKNLERDKNKNELLAKEGWTVLRFFESEINNNPQSCVERIENFFTKYAFQKAGDIWEK